MDEKGSIYLPPDAELQPPSIENLATRWTRLGGSFIDGILSLIVMYFVMSATEYWDRVISGNLTIQGGFILGLFGITTYLALNGYLLSKYGQTIGKRAIGTKIVSIDTEDVLPLWKVILLRQMPIVLAGQFPMIGQLLVLADSLFVFRKDKRCIHDLIAGTKAIKVLSTLR